MKSLDTQQFQDMLDQGEDMTVINVLSEQQHAREHIPGTINIPLDDEDFLDRVDDAVASREDTVIVYCASKDCDASWKAAKKLTSAGFENVYDYEAGLMGWKAAGQEVEGD